MSETSSQREPWRRFTLLDLLLLIPCFGAGFSLVQWAQAIARDAPPLPRPIGLPETVRMRPLWPAEASVAELFVVGCVLGCVIAGPVVLVSHWLFRGRKRGASLGEVLWLAPPLIVVVCALGAGVTRALGAAPAALWLPVLLLSALIASSQAFWVVFFSWPIDRDDVACRWTDRFGGLTSLLAWSLVFYIIVIACLDLKA